MNWAPEVAGMLANYAVATLVIVGGVGLFHLARRRWRGEPLWQDDDARWLASWLGMSVLVLMTVMAPHDLGDRLGWSAVTKLLASFTMVGVLIAIGGAVASTRRNKSQS